LSLIDGDEEDVEGEQYVIVMASRTFIFQSESYDFSSEILVHLEERRKGEENVIAR